MLMRKSAMLAESYKNVIGHDSNLADNRQLSVEIFIIKREQHIISTP
jgi:hypothetical protein